MTYYKNCKIYNLLRDGFNSGIHKYIHFDEYHKVSESLTYSYDILMKNSSEMIEGTYMLFANVYSGTNIGHDVSIFLDFLDYYKKNNLKCKILLLDKTKRMPRMIEFINLYFNEIDIIYMDSNKVYNFERVIIRENETMDIYKHRYLIDMFINLNKKNDKLEHNGKNIFIVKNHTHKQVMTKGDVYYCPKLIEELKKQEWIIINPEEMSLYDICSYLSNAKKIVTSHGQISYFHEIFFNRKAEWNYIKIKNTIQLPYQPECHKYKIVEFSDIDLDLHLKENIKLLIGLS